MSIASRLKAVGIGSAPFIYRKGEFSSKRGERVGIWNVESGNHYASCAACGAINRFKNTVGSMTYFDRRDLYPAVDSCIVCIDCKAHFFIVLTDKEWPIELTVDQKKVLKIIRRGFRTRLGSGLFSSKISFPYNTIVAAIATTTKGSSNVTAHGGHYILYSSLNGVTSLLSETFGDWESAVRRMVEQFR